LSESQRCCRLTGRLPKRPARFRRRQPRPAEGGDNDGLVAGILSDDYNEDEAFAIEEYERGIVEGECLDDFDLEEFDNEDVEHFLHDEDDPSDEIEG
jgi:hypothetical protein